MVKIELFNYTKTLNKLKKTNNSIYQVNTLCALIECIYYFNTSKTSLIYK